MNAPLPDENRLMPQAVSDAMLAFPANVVGSLLPTEKDIPESFQRGWHHRTHEWCGPVNEWFHKGIDSNRFVAKPGIDANAAWRHLGACMHSFEPSHEHKIAGVGYLMSLWFDHAPKAAA